MGRNRINYVIGFTTPYLIPHHVIQDLSKFLSEFTVYDQDFHSTLAKTFSDTSTLFRHTGLVILERKGTNAIIVSQIQQGFFAHPWGLAPPPCPCGMINLTLDGRRSKGAKELTYLATCQSCDSRAKLTEPPHALSVAGSKNLWSYPWPQDNRDFWSHVQWQASPKKPSSLKRKLEPED